MLLEQARKIASSLQPAQLEELERVASLIACRGKGILAADESARTIGKRLVKAGLSNDAETRRAYRQVLFSHDLLGNYLSGCILNEETLFQLHSDGRSPLPEILSSKGILVGVKTDKGLTPLSDSPEETSTLGMGDLLERSRRYRAAGARFAKWRAVIKIDADHNLPTRSAIQINSEELALYAAISMEAGLVPIVEPEVLIDGSHTVEKFAQVSEDVLGSVFGALAEARVPLECCILKPQMMMAGADAKAKHSQDQLVQLTLKVLRRRVPPALPGIVFLSGGQSEEDATLNLNAINQAADASASGKHPWTLSFSFGRSLQASVLDLWKEGGDEAEARAIAMAGDLAAANARAQQGTYGGPHPSIVHDKMLLDPNRGWQK